MFQLLLFAFSEEEVEAHLKTEGFVLYNIKAGHIVGHHIQLEAGQRGQHQSEPGIEEVGIVSVKDKGTADDEFHPVENVDTGSEGGVVTKCVDDFVIYTDIIVVLFA